MKKKQQKAEIRRITEYMISGGAYFWTGYGVFFICDKVFGLNLWWAKLSANIAGWVVNYMLQRYWVFKNPALAKHQTQVTSRYIFITLVNFVLDYFIIRGLKGIGITPYIGQFISSGFFTVWNYLWYRLWVFPESFSKASPKHATRPKVRLVAHHPYGAGAYKQMRTKRK